jgi:predicted amidohydrolase YtcJ
VADLPGDGDLLIAGAEIGGRRVDVRVRQGAVAEVAGRLRPRTGEAVLPARGGALLPGLRDHHVHLRAVCAARRSVWCGPPVVRDRPALAARLRRAAAAAPAGTWIRGIGYHESVAGPLDRRALDAILPDRPARIQHRSGQLWVVNTAGARLLHLSRPDGRLLRADRWLRHRLGRDGAPEPAEMAAELAATGRRLASFGVTGLTDATVTNGPGDATGLPDAVPQEVLVMGDDRLERGPFKVVLHDDDLPPLDDLEAAVRRAHDRGRPVAVHCVGRASLWLALTALEGAGPAPGDRIEHGSVIPPEALPPLRRLGLTVVTQPNFVGERGDAYLADVDPADRPWLYRVGGLLRAGVGVAGGTDAPFGHPDPWRAMAAAVTRRTDQGTVLGPCERVSPEQALALFTGALGAPWRPLGVVPGSPADLCLLAVPWRQARSQLSSDLVTATVRAGRLIFRRDGLGESP